MIKSINITDIPECVKVAKEMNCTKVNIGIVEEN